MKNAPTIYVENLRDFIYINPRNQVKKVYQFACSLSFCHSASASRQGNISFAMASHLILLSVAIMAFLPGKLLFSLLNFCLLPGYFFWCYLHWPAFCYIVSLSERELLVILC